MLLGLEEDTSFAEIIEDILAGTREMERARSCRLEDIICSVVRRTKLGKYFSLYTPRPKYEFFFQITIKSSYRRSQQRNFDERSGQTIVKT
jgi:hypothetical protein